MSVYRVFHGSILLWIICEICIQTLQLSSVFQPEGKQLKIQKPGASTEAWLKFAKLEFLKWRHKKEKERERERKLFNANLQPTQRRQSQYRENVNLLFCCAVWNWTLRVSDGRGEERLNSQNVSVHLVEPTIPSPNTFWTYWNETCSFIEYHPTFKKIQLGFFAVLFKHWIQSRYDNDRFWGWMCRLRQSQLRMPQF